ALIAALPADGVLFRSEVTTFRPQDFEASNLVLGGYRATAALLDGLEDGSGEPQGLAEHFANPFGPAQAGKEGNTWTLEFGEGADRGRLTRAVFGTLVEQEPSPGAVAVLQALAHLAASGGSLQIR